MENEKPTQNPYHDDPASASDSEDDQAVHNARSSTEVADYDRQLLLDEEEREELLTEKRSTGRQSFFRRKGGTEGQNQGFLGKTSRNRSRKAQNRNHGGGTTESGELLYELEEGAAKDDTSSQASSSSADHQDAQTSKISKRKMLLIHIGLGVVIVLLFLLITSGAYQASRSRKSRIDLSVKSNGTSEFAPTTILLSLDGFRADFLHRGLTPTLNSFIAEGVSPKYMLPSFPSVTFPNHYTLVTGLYPESHGVVGNTFWDPALNEDFYYTDPTRSMQPKWWAGGEPLWVTTEKANVTTAVHMWPGSEAHIMSLEPTFLDKFNGTEDLTRKVSRILELLDTPDELATAARPQLIAAYVPVVDADGHTYGPNSTEIRKTIKQVDSMLYTLFSGLEQRNLTSIVNIVVVSDHGMATTSTERLIQLDDLIDLTLVDRIDGWPLYGLRPKSPADLQGLYAKLLEEAEHNEHFDVYVKETMPERYHFSNNDRIAPLWVIPKTGWAIVHKEDFDVKDAKAKGEVYHPKGLHGYDHEHPLMRSIFIARGPAFPHEPNSRLEVFQNIEVYNIVCDSLGIEPKPNNGTLRLPLKTIGVHSDPPAAVHDVPEDLPSDADMASTTPPSNISQKIGLPTSTAGVKQGTDDIENDTDDESSFWGIIRIKFEAAKAWADDVVNKLGGS
ncbi:MAG: hypothetical protein LQ341_003835 [Variospora aurantia]|nr:MAG: hypothetical protein LQ341_003835 [Variospora aurantia]